jgi:hypothetical protein
MPIEYKDVQVTKRIGTSATCDSCGQELIPIDLGGMATNFTGALRITISSGYGEYNDSHGSCILCQTCADHLSKNHLLRAAFDEADNEDTMPGLW